MKIYLKKVPWTNCDKCYFYDHIDNPIDLTKCKAPVSIKCTIHSKNLFVKEIMFVKVSKKEYNKHITAKNKP